MANQTRNTMKTGRCQARAAADGAGVWDAVLLAAGARRGRCSKPEFALTAEQ
jgi:hypothetical protein